MIDNLERMNPLREPALRSAIRALQLPAGSRGLDVGCGIGLQALLLADATRPNGHVTGLDISHRLLAYARRKVGGSPIANCISFRQGDMRMLPFGDDAFDWAWSVDCVGYPSGDLLPILMEISRVVRPGGLIALLAWSSQQLLPGHAMLEARLNATCSPYAPLLQGQPPHAHFHRALHWFPQAGIVKPACTTIVGQVQAPLEPELRDAVTLLLEMLWGHASAEASKADMAEYRRLCSPQSPDFILGIPEYNGFFTYTMFTGSVAEKQ
jgi:demethylmenaquinone methyltransferase/2-methoxy-6-polyprenyl-1,4-benzoquinol methylase